ncbi:hypothetical protein K503DRAFT_777159 [Rhizopogon vinicolor AM-OR11-026]|uniref:Uncharacterized protein n=1 Tax=Rhizopogon vinicolor AM-OR11-026 TaxID=1314800 RepID=A0A1B7MH76_9AGAM|nr:hypothetical protein K503DRAFT_777159 [Rhizopogon vinicolor AM-OR11-026]
MLLSRAANCFTLAKVGRSKRNGGADASGKMCKLHSRAGGHSSTSRQRVLRR